MREQIILSLSDAFALMEEEDTLRAEEPASSPRHPDMCRVCEDGTHLLIFWGGYEYALCLVEIKKPEDLLWRLLHLSRKTGWDHMTPRRLGRAIEMVAGVKGWEVFEHIPQPHYAPVPRQAVLAERAKVTPSMRYEVIRRDGYRCRACGFSVQDGAHLHVDHIRPVSLGGRSTMDNLQTLCSACNIGKGAKS